MKHWMSLALALTVFSNAWSNAPLEENVIEEVLYYDFQEKIESGKGFNHFLSFSPKEQTLFVDALWDLSEEGNSSALKFLDEMDPFHYELTDQLRVAILKMKYRQVTRLPGLLEAELLNVLLIPSVDTRLIYTIAAYEAELLKAGHDEIIYRAKNHPEYFDIAAEEVKAEEVSTAMVADLFHHTPDVTTYMNGEYVKSIKLFMFCRDNRLYPCLMVMKDIHGEIVRNKDGSIWTNPALASSARGIPSYSRNGNTPAGVLTIDSVMPSADQQLSFGKFRRMILNFIPKSKSEALTKKLIPESSHQSDWWKPAVVARDIGRNLLRIHGTGKINKDPSTPYFPFMRTSGCIAQRENTYGSVTYKDQRELLDDVMRAMDMAPKYSNEVSIKGFLYIVDLDDENSPVTERDLALRGIE